jgi:hypothetical protein
MKHDIDIAEKAKEFKIPVLFVRSKSDVVRMIIIDSNIHANI